MPKILLYITAKVIWSFLFWNTDYNEKRAHVHVGKRSTEHLCKIWLEPVVELDKQGRVNVTSPLIDYANPNTAFYQYVIK